MEEQRTKLIYQKRKKRMDVYLYIRVGACVYERVIVAEKEEEKRERKRRTRLIVSSSLWQCACDRHNNESNIEMSKRAIK